MSDTGMEFGFLLAKLGPIELREGTVRLTPVIDSGTTYVDDGPLRARYKAPDTFRCFEIELKLPTHSFLRFRRSAKLEMWTHTDVSGYVHWCFPHIMWSPRPGNTFFGVTYEGTPYVPEDIPDGMAIGQGAFWKVSEVPL